VTAALDAAQRQAVVDAPADLGRAARGRAAVEVDHDALGPVQHGEPDVLEPARRCRQPDPRAVRACEADADAHALCAAIQRRRDNPRVGDVDARGAVANGRIGDLGLGELGGAAREVGDDAHERRLRADAHVRHGQRGRRRGWRGREGEDGESREAKGGGTHDIDNVGGRGLLRPNR
jgi:hypothetical protein